ncbi:hypothetical protein [Nocardioides jensenii]|uniref:hypothetical protein n=1 Tax=Nocardioides jensenii TaxID=1843 RepID=UPI00082ADE22|nr:hypothetical protein [Nocardioides jensenii]
MINRRGPDATLLMRRRRPWARIALGALALVLAASAGVALSLAKPWQDEPNALSAPSDSPSTTPSTQPTTSPSGIDGMRFVFPSLDRDFDACRTGRPYGAKINAMGCIERFAGALTETVYSEWSSHAAMLRHYRGKYGTQGVRRGELVYFGPSYITNQTTKMQYSVAYAAAHPFSVTVTADVEREPPVRQAMARVEWRPTVEIAD